MKLPRVQPRWRTRVWNGLTSASSWMYVGTLAGSGDSEDPGLIALDEGYVEWHLTIDSGAAVSVVPEGWADGHLSTLWSQPL